MENVIERKIWSESVALRTQVAQWHIGIEHKRETFVRQSYPLRNIVARGMSIGSRQGLQSIVGSRAYYVDIRQGQVDKIKSHLLCVTLYGDTIWSLSLKRHLVSFCHYMWHYILFVTLYDIIFFSFLIFFHFLHKRA